MNNIPTITKNLLIVNVVVFLATYLFRTIGVDLNNVLGLHFFLAPDFHIYQLFTYMFAHGGFSHIFFNMFALWMFGRALEYEMGSQRFLTYYLVCGIGAALLQLAVGYAEYTHAVEAVGQIAAMDYLRVPTVGASGAIFGLLMAFGVLHPNDIIMLIFPPVALKAKWFVVIYGLVELFFGLSGYQSGVAHFAHVGGMLWGLVLLYWWRRRGRIHF